MVVGWLFLAVKLSRLQFEIVVFPDHTHKLFSNNSFELKKLNHHKVSALICHIFRRAFKTNVVTNNQPRVS